jgi:hypothetical protein
MPVPHVAINLRNHIAHPDSSLIENNHSLQNLWEGIEKMDAINEKLMEIPEVSTVS